MTRGEVPLLVFNVLHQMHEHSTLEEQAKDGAFVPCGTEGQAKNVLRVRCNRPPTAVPKKLQPPLVREQCGAKPAEWRV